jgi:type II secretory pathway component PulF
MDEPVPLTPVAVPLIVYTRKFCALIEAGVSLMVCMKFLRETTTDPTMREANEFLTRSVEAGATLSQAMADRPAVFSRFYIAFVHAGEIGGVLDEAFVHLADWLEQERDAAERLHLRALLAKLRRGLEAGGASPDARARDAFSRARRMARIASFCRLFEMMLTAGVPSHLALRTAGEVLEPEIGAVVPDGVEGLTPERWVTEVVERVEEFMPVVASLVGVGEEQACLDHMLRKAAQFYDAEAAGILHEAAQVPS